MNPCPCGNFGDPPKACRCTPAVISKCQNQIPAPLLDRINIHGEVLRVDYEKLSGNLIGETGEAIRKRVQRARNIEQQRFTSAQSNIIRNTDTRVGEIRQFYKLQDDGQSLMQAAMSQLNLSACAYHRILKLPRTIADLGGSDEINSLHSAEAPQYRQKLMLG